MAITDILSDAGAFANPFGAPSNSKWNLSRGVFTNKVTGQSLIFFYEDRDPDPSQKTGVDQITDSGGRRIAIYEYPYRDGQRLDDLGRKGEKFTFNIKFWGQNYQVLFQKFLDVVVNTSNQGILTHPIRSGSKGIPVRFSEWEFIHRYDEWSAITIRATFIEDNTDTLAQTNTPAPSQDSALRSALQTLTTIQATIQQGIFNTGAILLLPSTVISAMNQRLQSIGLSASSILGKLAATFATDAQIQALSAQAISVGGFAQLTAGTIQIATQGVQQNSQLPPVYQVGFDSTTQAAITAQLSSFLNANQITPQQAVFQANQVRASITLAIKEIDTNFGNDGYNLILAYRSLANSIQSAVEAAIASAQALVKQYTVPFPMSLRMVAFKNGLPPDSQNDIEALNPYLASVNYIPTDTVITVPAA